VQVEMTHIWKHIIKLFLIFITVLLVSCKNYYNDAIAWMDNIEEGTHIDVVKENQPEFITIDWDNPENHEKEKWYYVEKIKGNNDPLNMSHQLVFVENKYEGRESHK
jgi:hypothetical protein